MGRPRHTDEGYADQRALMTAALRQHFGADVPAEILVHHDDMTAPTGHESMHGGWTLIGYRDGQVVIDWQERGRAGADRLAGFNRYPTAEVVRQLPDDVGFFFDAGVEGGRWIAPPLGWSPYEDR
jgi:hypothetical protein